MADSQPYLSVVVTSRNDNHGQSLLRRMQTFVNAFISQCKRHGLRAELIIVEWNPPTDRPRLAQALRWPADTGPCLVRIIEVPPQLHARLQHGVALPLYQMIAKNVGIRRARGKFVAATNIDILLSDELVSFLAAESLQPGRMYRVDRWDVETDVPVDAPVTEQLAYCQSHLIRLNCREGTVDVTSEGLRRPALEDVVGLDQGVFFDESWYPPERTNGRPFRWVGPNAWLNLRVPEGAARNFAVEMEPGPGMNYEPFELEVRDIHGRPVARGHVEGRQLIHLALPVRQGHVERFQFCTREGGLPTPFEPRLVNYRVLRCRWTEGPQPDSTHAPASGTFNFRAEDVYELLPVDVAEPAVGIRVGRGWHPVEHDNGVPYRWVGDNGRLVITAPARRGQNLSLEIAPGPGVDYRPFELQVRDAQGRVVARGIVEQRQIIHLALPLQPGETGYFQIHAVGGGARIANDPRIMNFRIAHCRWSAGAEPLTMPPPSGPFNFRTEELYEIAGEDIAPADMGVRFGGGWHSVEKWEDVVYRWVANDATFTVEAPAGPPRNLSLELQPGPGLQYRPFELEVRDSCGRTVARGMVTRRQMVHLALPVQPGHKARFQLHVDDGGYRIPTDPRIMNFRTACCRWTPGPNPVAAPASSASPFNIRVEEVYELAQEDIAAQDLGLRFGSGWHAVERDKKSLFRWVGNDAWIAVTAPAGPVRDLTLELQPGPGVEYRPFELHVRDAEGKMVARGTVVRRQLFRLALPLRPGQTMRFQLQAVGGGKMIATDPRIMNLRVALCDWATGSRLSRGTAPATGPFNFLAEDMANYYDDEPLPTAGAERPAPRVRQPRAPAHRPLTIEVLAGKVARRLTHIGNRCGHLTGALVARAGSAMKRLPIGRIVLRRLAEHSPAKVDIVAPGLHLRFGGGWHPAEQSKGVVSRWVGDEAWLAARAPTEGTRTLSIELEPGPGVNHRPFQLEVVGENGHTILGETIAHRQVIHLPFSVQPGQTERFHLRVVRVPPLAASAARKNYRVLHCGWSRPEIVSPLPLHTCACGDWTMLALEDWCAVRAYPEFDMYSLHIDSTLCFMAQHAGFEEVVLKDPMRTYHIEHGAGSGWTPEGEAKLFARLQAQGIPILECLTVLKWATEMRRMERPMIFNDDTWGFAGEQLPETEIGGHRLEHRAVA